MDVTPQLIKDVEFRQALRGYDPDEVDLFLQRVGASIAQLEGRLTEALSRAEAAEGRLDGGAARGARSIDAPSEETITRTLVLAQQTADKLIGEARDEASATLSQVQNEAAELRGAAQAEAEEMTSSAKLESEQLRETTTVETSELRSTTTSETDAMRVEAELVLATARSEAQSEREAILGEVESEARAVAEATRAPLLEEIRGLESTRDDLITDNSLLTDHLAEQRNNAQAALHRFQEVIDDPEVLRSIEAPALASVQELTPEVAIGDAEAVVADDEPEIDLSDSEIDSDAESVDGAVEDSDEAADGADVAEEPAFEELEIVDDVDVSDEADSFAEAKLADELEAPEPESPLAVVTDHEDEAALDLEIDEATESIEPIESSGRDVATFYDVEAEEVPEFDRGSLDLVDDQNVVGAPDELDIDADLAAEGSLEEPLGDSELINFDSEEVSTDLGFVEQGESSSDVHAEVDADLVASADDSPAAADGLIDFEVDELEDEIEIIDLTEEEPVPELDLAGDAPDLTQRFDAISDRGQSEIFAEGDEATGDAFLDELRRAVSDESPSGDDAALVAFFDDDSDGPTRRFGRRG